MWTASSAARSGATARLRVQLVAPAQLGEDPARLLAVRIELALLGPPPGPLLDRGVEEELQVGVGQDDRPDVAAGHDDPARLRGEGPLPLEQGRAELGDPADGRDRVVDARGVDLVGHVARRRRVTWASRPFASATSSISETSPTSARRIGAGAVDADLPLEGEPGRGPVQQAGVAEAVAEAERGGGADARLPGRARPIEGDDETGLGSGHAGEDSARCHRGRAGAGFGSREGRRLRQPRISGALSGRTRPLRRPSIRTGPIRTRTSRSIGASTAPNIRRSWRFQPWRSVARYQVRSGGAAGARSSASLATSVAGHPPEVVQVGLPSSSGIPRSSAAA